MLPKTQQRGCQVFVATESGSRRDHLYVLAWRVFGHATASRADAGLCILN